jgi:Fe-S-cluster-containing dehydrogenase component
VSNLGFLFDLNQCTGCAACELACSMENDLGWGNSWRKVYGSQPLEPSTDPRFFLSLACNHCEDAPCQDQCPALAFERDAITGALLIQEDKCIGCRYCSWVCPYGAPVFKEDDAVMQKCTLCSPRLIDGLEPACVNSCPTSALKFGELQGPETVDGFPDTDARPRVRFEPLRPNAVLPRLVLPADISWPAAGQGTRQSLVEIGMKQEWPLWVLTSVAPLLVACHVLQIETGWWGVGAAFGGMMLSTLHLGKKSRAWRAVLNLRRSWLSREIFFFSGFAGTLLLSTLLPAWQAFALWPGLLSGLLALLAMDRLYDPVRPGRGTMPFDPADCMFLCLGWIVVLRIGTGEEGGLVLAGGWAALSLFLRFIFYGRLVVRGPMAAGKHP